MPNIYSTFTNYPLSYSIFEYFSANSLYSYNETTPPRFRASSSSIARLISATMFGYGGAYNISSTSFFSYSSRTVLYCIVEFRDCGSSIGLLPGPAPPRCTYGLWEGVESKLS